MATTTIVITYTAGAAGTGDDDVTSATVDGTAYASLTAAQVKKTLQEMIALDKLMRKHAGEGNAALSAAGRAAILAGIGSAATYTQ
jgi:hypothetical protein